jgi:hypothetical protein
VQKRGGGRHKHTLPMGWSGLDSCFLNLRLSLVLGSLPRSCTWANGMWRTLLVSRLSTSSVPSSGSPTPAPSQRKKGLK